MGGRPKVKGAEKWHHHSRDHVWREYGDGFAATVQTRMVAGKREGELRVQLTIPIEGTTWDGRAKADALYALIQGEIEYLAEVRARGEEEREELLQKELLGKRVCEPEPPEPRKRA